ncbi:MAG: glycosyltransferase, partial [Acidobacteriota bacterium]
IVGDGELRGELEALARATGLESKVRFLGWRGDLDTIYGATDVFMLTSRNEGTPVALIEAMASGVASVSTDVGGVRDVIADTSLGALVPFGDPEALAAAVASYIGSPALHDLTGASAREAVARKFDSRRLLDDIARLYDRLLTLPE